MTFFSRTCFRLFYWLPVLLWCSDTLSARQYVYRRYDTHDGLAASVVHGLAQDQDGFLWLCTQAGLCRFDGKQFRTYTRNDGLPSNEVLFVLPDSRNRVWIASFKHAVCYYYKGRIYNQQNDPQLRQLQLSQPVSGICETTAGAILINTGPKGYYLLPPDTSAVVLLPSLAELPVQQYGRISKGELPWGILPASLRGLYDGLTGYFGWLKPYPGAQPTYLFNSNKGLLLVPGGDTGSRYRLHIPELLLACIFNDSLLTVTSRKSGFRFYNIRSRQFGQENYLPGFRVHDVFRDREGIFWYSTDGAGVLRMMNPAVQYYSLGDQEQPLSVYHVSRFLGRLTVITKKGEYRELKVAGGDSQYQVRQVQADRQRIIAEPGRLVHYQDINFFQLFGSRAKPLLTMLKTLYYERDTLLIAGHTGVYRMKYSNMQLLDTLMNTRATCAARFGDRIYIGTLEGLYSYKDGQLVYEGQQHAPLRNRISTLAGAADSTLWVGTYEDGVIGIRGKRMIAHLNEQNNGLSSNICRCLYLEGHYLWAGTEKGISKTDISLPMYPVVARYDCDDGLKSEVINSLMIEGKRVYAGTQAGLMIFDEDEVPAHSRCDLKLTELGISGRTIHYPDLKPLQLPHQDHNVRFVYSGLSFRSGGQMQYRYRLRGLSDDWQYTTEQSISYPALPSGSYTFQIRAINKFGDESALVEQSFHIQPLVWERKEFWLLLILLLAAITVLVFRYRIGVIKRKERDRQKVNRQLMDLEQMALRAQMNPHFIFNCLNSIQHVALESDVRSVNFYITRFARLIRSTLENAARVYISLQEEIDYLDTYLALERMQHPAAFSYSIRVAPGINALLIAVPNMVLQPLVENAVKHGVSRLGEQGRIDIVFDTIGNYLRCVISDNGPGFGQEPNRTAAIPVTPHRSRGLTITEERIRILNELSDTEQQISLSRSATYPEAQPAYGALITVLFPIQNIHFLNDTGHEKSNSR